MIDIPAPGPRRTAAAPRARRLTRSAGGTGATPHHHLQHHHHHPTRPSELRPPPGRAEAEAPDERAAEAPDERAGSHERRRRESRGQPGQSEGRIAPWTRDASRPFLPRYCPFLCFAFSFPGRRPARPSKGQCSASADATGSNAPSCQLGTIPGGQGHDERSRLISWAWARLVWAEPGAEPGAELGGPIPGPSPRAEG